VTRIRGILKKNNFVSKKMRGKNTSKIGKEISLSALLIIGLVGISFSVPFLLSSVFGDHTGAFITAAIFSMASISMVFWSSVQTIKNSRIKGAEELEKQLSQAINMAKLDINGINVFQDKEIKDLREKIKNVDSLTSLLDLRIQELNKTYIIFIKLIKIIEYLECLSDINEEIIKIIESEVLKRDFARRRKPEKIDVSDLNW
jgi:hypothetical protein